MFLISCLFQLLFSYVSFLYNWQEKELNLKLCQLSYVHVSNTGGFIVVSLNFMFVIYTRHCINIISWSSGQLVFRLFLSSDSCSTLYIASLDFIFSWEKRKRNWWEGIMVNEEATKKKKLIKEWINMQRKYATIKKGIPWGCFQILFNYSFWNIIIIYIKQI